MMTVFEVSETFLSLEGEAAYTNRPTIYTRFARCNFKCWKFNNPLEERTGKGYAPLTFNPKDYTKLEDLPMIDVGCDSQYSVNPEFQHLWRKLTTDEVIDELLELLPGNSWIHPRTGMPYIYSITGGEPTLHWKKLPELINHDRMKDCRHVLVETNAAVPFKDSFLDGIRYWLTGSSLRKWTWSISPKMSCSGEIEEDAIRPEIVRKMYDLVEEFPHQCDLYLKYVAGDNEEDFAEIDRFNAKYFTAIPVVDTWIMPMACTDGQQNEIVQAVANRCIQQGYYLSYRTQNAIWGNGIGT